MSRLLSLPVTSLNSYIIIVILHAVLNWLHIIMNFHVFQLHVHSLYICYYITGTLEVLNRVSPN